MNFLAHLYLAEPTPESYIGNLLPDLVRGPLPEGLSPAVVRGVVNHRRVDVFTDAHPVFARSRDRLRKNHDRFAGILVDVFYDHFLAVGWSRYHTRPLNHFLGEAHGWLRGPDNQMPPAMRQVAHQMAEQQWMASYDTVAGIEQILGRMSRYLTGRLKRPVALEQAARELVDQRAELADDFATFFPDLIAHIGVDHRPTPAACTPPPEAAMPLPGRTRGVR